MLLARECSQTKIIRADSGGKQSEMIVLERLMISGGSVEQAQLYPIHLNWIYEVPLAVD